MSRPVEDSGWRAFGRDLFYRHLAIGSCSGPLSHLAGRGMSVGSKDGLIVALGLPVVVPAQVQADAVASLLSCREKDSGEQASVRFVEDEVWRIHQSGGFFRTVPEILAASVVGGDESVLVWRAGPNGVALADEAGVTLASEDLRYAALERLGVDLGLLRPQGLAVDPLADQVSALSQIEPGEVARQEVLAGRGQVALLMSRGAFPFSPPAQVSSGTHWWKLDSGWRYGMAADVLVVASQANLALADVSVDGFGRS